MQLRSRTHPESERFHAPMRPDPRLARGAVRYATRSNLNFATDSKATKPKVTGSNPVGRAEKVAGNSPVVVGTRASPSFPSGTNLVPN